MASSSAISNKTEVNTWIPQGYQLVVGPDNAKYIVPEFIIPALRQDYETEEMKKRLLVTNAAGTVSFRFPVLVYSGTGKLSGTGIFSGSGLFSGTGIFIWSLNNFDRLFKITPSILKS